LIFRLLPAANAELWRAANYFELKRRGLGGTFLGEFEKAIERLREYHHIGPVAVVANTVEYRELLINRFPYRLIYAVEHGGVVIIAVAHQRRRSGYWRDRVEEPVPAYEISLAA
jgi:plasmid stabilization system protein ParE